MGSEPSAAARHADRAVEFLRLHNVVASPHGWAPSPSVAAVMLDQVRQYQARVLVMGAYGQPTLREFFLGSVTRTVVQHSHVPLFLSHSRSCPAREQQWPAPCCSRTPTPGPLVAHVRRCGQVWSDSEDGTLE